MISTVLRNESNVTDTTLHRTGDPITGKGTLYMSRLLYQRLGSKRACMEISRDYAADRLPPEFMKILKELDAIDEPGAIANPLAADLDEYLGSLGITDTYSYSKDFFDTPPWLFVDKQSEYRLLDDPDDNTILADIDPITGAQQILITYTGV